MKCAGPSLPPLKEVITADPRNFMTAGATPLPPAIIGGAEEPGLIDRLRLEHFFGPNAGLSEILVPAGYVKLAYDARFKLSDDQLTFLNIPSEEPTVLNEPGLPFSLVFRCEPGKEDLILKIASAYESASRRRISPPQFGPVKPKYFRTKNH